MTSLKTTIFLSLLTIPLVISLQANAQSFGETLDVTFTPQSPSVGEKVSMTVKNVVKDLNRIQITWSLDGKIVKQGIGEKNFEFNLGSMGSVSSVTVSAGGLSKNVQIRPTDIDLVWETDGYAPPFYKGKTLRVFQGNVRLVAIPHFITPGGSALDRKKLVYTWRNGGILNPSGSGYGKNYLIYSGSIISHPLNIKVEVSSLDGDYKGSKGISVQEIEPKILLYEDHPLYGTLYNNALNDKEFVLNDKEVRATAMPYFFSTQNINASKLKYSWSINGARSNNPSFKNSVVFRQEGSVAGASNVSLSLENSEEFMQASRAAFNIKFEGENATSSSQNNI